MNISILTPDKILYEGEASLVQFPGIDGSFELLENHAPMIAVLKKGKIRLVDLQKEIHFFEINAGIVEVNENKAQVLAQ